MKKNKVRKAVNVIKNVICWSLVVILVFTVIIFLTSRIKGEAPSVFGYTVLRVSSGSMEPELEIGDVILDKAVDNPEKLKVGDVVTYKSDELGLLVTHKVIKAPYKKNGTLMLQTQGVANDVADAPIRADSVKGVMVSKIQFLDAVYNVFLSPWGLLILIGLIILIFIDEIIAIVKILTRNDKSAKDAENINDIIDRIQAEKKENLDGGSEKDE